MKEMIPIHFTIKLYSFQPGEDAYLSANIIEHHYGRAYFEMKKDLKIYLYKVEADSHVPTRRYQMDWGGKYDTEAFFIHLLSKSQHRTMVRSLVQFVSICGCIPNSKSTPFLTWIPRQQSELYVKCCISNANSNTFNRYKNSQNANITKFCYTTCRVKAETQCAMRRLSMAFNSLTNVNLIEQKYP